MDSIKKIESLDTSYVNLSALIRYLRERLFNGRLRIVLDQYEADVLMYGESQPSIREWDQLSGREAEGQEAFERLLVRAREPGGSITIYEDLEAKGPAPIVTKPAVTQTDQRKAQVTEPAVGSDSLLAPAAELVAAVERAVQTTGTEFAEAFRIVRVELGDDYPFLDPSLGGFEYVNGRINLHARPSRSAFVNGVAEALRRVVNNVAGDQQGARFRERVAVELAVAVRRHTNGLGEFGPRLDQIAGTRVL